MPQVNTGSIQYKGSKPQRSGNHILEHGLNFFLIKRITNGSKILMPLPPFNEIKLTRSL